MDLFWMDSCWPGRRPRRLQKYFLAAMERRPMAPHQQSSLALEFPASFQGLDFGQNGAAGDQQYFMVAKQQSSTVKQEMPSPNRQQPQSSANAPFLPQNIGCCAGDHALSIDQLSALHSSTANAPSDFFAPAALHQLLLQPENGVAVNSANAAYFCAAAPSSSSSAPADPQPSSAQIAEKPSLAKTANGPSNGGNKDRKRPYPCTLCASKFGSKMELEEHQNSHTGQKPFQCDVCQSRFNRRSTLWNHKRIHSDAKPFVCTVCHMQFKWKNSLKCHKEMHLRKNELTQGALMPDADSHALTYATAAKKKMGELTGADPSSITLLPASNASSHLLTCAGTPRKRAPPKAASKGPKQQQQKAKMPIGGGQPKTANGHQKMMGNGGGTAFKGNGSKGKAKEGNWGGTGENVKGDGNEAGGGNGVTATATAMATELDLFRLPCGIIPPIASSSDPINGLHIPPGNVPQSPFLHVDPLIRPNASSAYCPLDSSNPGQNHPQHQQIAPSLLLNNQIGQGGAIPHQLDLLNSGQSIMGTNLLEQPQSSALCCNLLQDFQMGGGGNAGGAGGGIGVQQHIIEQQQSMRSSLQNANFLGFDINSLAMDPNLLVHASTSSASSSSAIAPQQFPACTQFMQNGQSLQNGCANSANSGMLNGYHFDSASMRFLTAAAVEQGISSGEIQQRLQSQIQQDGTPHLGTNPSIDYGLFSVDYGYPPIHPSSHDNQQLFSADNAGFLLDSIANDQQQPHREQHQQFTMSAALAHEQQHLLAMGGGGTEMPSLLMKGADRAGGDGPLLESDQHQSISRHRQQQQIHHSQQQQQQGVAVAGGGSVITATAISY